MRHDAAPTAPDLALEFLILTACRTNEVLGARWTEINAEAATWTIPAARMKASKEHRVPLSNRALEILGVARKLNSTSEFVFPGFRKGKPLSNMAMLMKMRRMQQPYTVHGFRSAFRDWASERTHFTREVCEMSLAHTIKSKAEAAYRRGDLLEKRRDLMEKWSRFVIGQIGDVVQLRSGQK
nr:site-specific integrase [Aestuariivirga litoralis]